MGSDENWDVFLVLTEKLACSKGLTLCRFYRPLSMYKDAVHIDQVLKLGKTSPLLEKIQKYFKKILQVTSTCKRQAPDMRLSIHYRFYRSRSPM